eukprot:5782025-Amphidinium_carterae.3
MIMCCGRPDQGRLATADERRVLRPNSATQARSLQQHGLRPLFHRLAYQVATNTYEVEKTPTT